MQGGGTGPAGQALAGLLFLAQKSGYVHGLRLC